MKINKLQNEFNLSLTKSNLKTSFDFESKSSHSKEKKPTQINTTTNKVIFLYNTSNKLFQKIPKSDLIQSKAFNPKQHPSIPQSKSYLNPTKAVLNPEQLKRKELRLQISNSLKLFHSSSNTNYHTIGVWPNHKQPNPQLNFTPQATFLDENELKHKDRLIAKMNEQMSMQYIKIGELEGQVRYLKGKCKKMKEEACIIRGQSLSYQNDCLKLKGENEALKQHQLKLMKVMYMLKDKGVDIESIVNGVFQSKKPFNFAQEDNINESLEGITFPDKVYLKTNEEIKSVPTLNFDKVYLYQTACLEREDYHKQHYIKEHKALGYDSIGEAKFKITSQSADQTANCKVDNCVIKPSLLKKKPPNK